MPSSVLRIVRPFKVVADETTILTFDFDAKRSVVAAGPNLLLRPVVKLLVGGSSCGTATPTSTGGGNSGNSSGGGSSGGGNPGGGNSGGGNSGDGGNPNK